MIKPPSVAQTILKLFRAKMGMAASAIARGWARLESLEMTFFQEIDEDS